MNVFKGTLTLLGAAFQFQYIRRGMYWNRGRLPSRSQSEGTQDKREPSKWLQDCKREDGFFGDLSKDKIRLVLWVRVRG